MKQRNAGATSQIILLPGNDFTSAESFVTDGSGPALAKVTNPDSTTTNLVFDVHKYLDSDGSGTSPDCVGNYISLAFEPLAQWLRCNGRMALLVSDPRSRWERLHLLTKHRAKLEVAARVLARRTYARLLYS
jgi:hypothetical protein